MTQDETTHGIGRRGFLKAAGAIALTAGCNESEEPRSTTPTVTSSPTPEPLAQTSIQREALEHARDHYKLDQNRLIENSTPVYVRMEDFLDNSQIPEGFKDKQLGHWLDVPSLIDRPDVQPEENSFDRKVTSRDWKFQILKRGVRGMLDHDDWTMTGQPHILPDGTEGQGHHYRMDEEPNWDPDAFMPRWYNAKARVYNIEQSGEKQQDWHYLGPKPEEGDRVGKLGEQPENQVLDESFSVAKYLDGTSKEDLVGQPVTVCKVDWTEQGSHDYSSEPSEEIFGYAEDVLRDIGIQSYFIKGNNIGYTDISTDENDENTITMRAAWKENMPLDIQGPVEYGVMVNARGGGLHHFLPAGAGTIGNNGKYDKSTAKTLLHECYGHTFLGTGHPADGTDSIMEQGQTLTDPHMQFTDEEEDVIRRGIDIRSPARMAPRDPGFYNGMEPTYLPDNYFENVDDLYQDSPE